MDPGGGRGNISIIWGNIPKKQVLKECYKDEETLIIRWDKNKEINEAVNELSQHLIRSKWNPMATHSHGSWSFYVEIRNNYLY